MVYSAMRHHRRKTAMKITCTAVLLLIQTLQCLAIDDSPFQLTNKDTGFCLVKTNNNCNDLRWTTGDRLLVPQRNKCLGVQGKSVKSEITLYDCDETSEIQKWECKNGTLLALKGQELYIELTADNTAVLSKTVGPNNHLTITGTSSGACTRTNRELYAIGGNAAGLPCMFPFQYKDQWFSDCTTLDFTHLWCAVETKYQSERWGFCPVTSKDGWTIHPTTGDYYQLNTQAALTWSQADASCKQQGASLLSITDPHQQAYITALLGTGSNRLWIGLILDAEHGWRWTNGRPYRYMKWDSGHPLSNPGHICATIDPGVQYSWQSSPCSKKIGYICYSKAAEEVPTQAAETGFCSKPWIPYNGHCFHLNRTEKTWTDSQRDCRSQGGDLVSIRNVEDQSFLISQLEYISTDELWIGLNDKKTEGLFDWIDHSTVTFTSWEFGKPAVSTEVQDCVLMKGEKGNWADRACEEKHGSICMKMSASKPTGDEVPQDVGCKRGWRKHGSYCYFIGTQAKTFDQAKDDCKSSDSYLADVSNAVDNAFLVSLVGLRPEKYFWLGLSNQKIIDLFVWTNTDSVRFTNWNTGMPGHRQGCIGMKTGIFAGLWDVVPCTNKEKYICKHIADGAISTPAPPTLASTAQCAFNWNRLGRSNYCYKFFRDSSTRTWFEARDYCRTIGGDLLSVHSVEEHNSLPERYGTAWIGLTSSDSTTGYVWSDGSPLQFQHWEDGEPNNKNNVESCGAMSMGQRDESGSWNDLHCESYNPWLCKIRIGLTPKPPPSRVAPAYNRTDDGWIVWNGTQYYFNSRSMAMDEARRFCQSKHGDLITVNNEAESVFLWKQISKNYYGSFWIGLDVDLDKTYGWMDGSPVVFQRWDENQPTFVRNDENCAAITSHMGFWHVYNCGYQHRSICTRSSKPHANATVAPTVLPKGGCPAGWMKFDSQCYKIVNNQKQTWAGAKDQCKLQGGNLASIKSRQVQVYLTIKLIEAPTTNLWIGLFSVRGSSYLWTNGKGMRYTNWGTERRTPVRHYSHYMDSEMDYDMFYRPTYEERDCGLMTPNVDTGIGKWLKKSCNDTNGYICLRNLDSSLPDTTEPTTTDFVQIFNDSFMVFTQPMNWETAKKNCESNGAKLASLRNEWSQAYAELLTFNAKASLWIGMNKNETGGYFRFIDGWDISKTNWGRREPSAKRDCVNIDEEGKWKTTECSTTMGSICMKSTEVPPTHSTDYPGYCPDDPEQERHSSRQKYSWLSNRGNCYLFITERIQWPDASANCMKYGGHLASIVDPEEQKFIRSNIQMYEDNQWSFWIGLYRTHKGIWHWLDKTPIDYANWRDGEPDSSSYALISSSDGRWTTGSRWYDRGYICKTPKVPPKAVQPTARPHVDPQTRGHTILAVVLVIVAFAMGTVIALFLFKKSGRQLPIPERLSAFDNPLFFNNERFKPDLVDSNKLVANAEEVNPAPVITL